MSSSVYYGWPLDCTVQLPAEVLFCIFDYLAQPSVLRAARTSRRWRLVAIRHPQYYRLIRLHTDSQEFLTKEVRRPFHESLAEVSQSSVRLSIDLHIKNRHLIPGKMWIFLDILTRETLPLLIAARPLIKKLKLVFSYGMHPIVWQMLGGQALQLEGLTLKHDTFSESTAQLTDPDLPIDILGSQSHRLRTVSIAGICIPNAPIPAFKHVTNACVRYLRLDSTPRRLEPASFYPILRHLTLGLEWVHIKRPSHLPIDLPSSLSSLTLANVDDQDTALHFFRNVDLSPISDVALELRNPALVDWTCTLKGLLCKHILMRIHLDPADNRVPFGGRDTGNVVVTVSLSSDTNWTRTFRFLEFSRLSLGQHSKFNQAGYWESKFFRKFVDFRIIADRFRSITVPHALLPTVFSIALLYSRLRHLTIDLDALEGDFWHTDTSCLSAESRHAVLTMGWQNMFSDDPEWIETCKPVLDRNNPAADSHFDTQPEVHTTSCPCLISLTLRCSYGDCVISARQVAHFGRALGLLDISKPQLRPQLILRGVSLSQGRLHQKVFSKVVVEPLLEPAQRWKSTSS